MALGWILLSFFASAGAIFTDDYYTAAVLEHVKEDDPADRPAAILRNLAIYYEAARDARLSGADIIVFPESGIMPSRLMTPMYMKQYYEEVPDPKTNKSWIPCSQSFLAANFSGTGNPVITRLSCIAKAFEIYVVANIGEKFPCSPENSTECPASVQALFYNTNVVFDSNGTLVARHRKRFPFFETNISRPKLPEFTVFNTSFGSFGVIICFDSVFSEAVELVERFKVENLIISTWWFDELPLFSALGYFQGWSLGNNVNVLAANIHKPSTGSIGSLIVSKVHGALNYTFIPSRISSELLLAEVPRKSSYTPKIIETKQPPIMDGYRYTETNVNDYTLVRLESASGVVEACNNGLCCKLNYSSNTTPNDFFLAAFNGIQNVRNHYFFCQEICQVVLCTNGSWCKSIPTVSNVVFQDLSLSGNITTPHQYPSVTGTGLVLIPKSKWIFTPGHVEIISGSVQTPLLSVGIQGRCYDKDPPFPNSRLN